MIEHPAEGAEHPMQRSGPGLRAPRRRQDSAHEPVARSPRSPSGHGLEHEYFDRVIGLELAVAHKGDHLALGQHLHGRREVLAHRLLKRPAHLDDQPRLVVLLRLRSALSNDSCSTHTTRSSRIDVRAFVGPRPVYSWMMRSKAFEIEAASDPLPSR